MKREELILGICIYTLIVAAGFSAPILKKLRQLGWENPVSKGVRAFLIQSGSPSAAKFPEAGPPKSEGSWVNHPSFGKKMTQG